MAYPAYQNNGGIATGQDYSVSVPYPTSISANNILIAQLYDEDNDSFNTPTGWTKISEHTTNNNFSDALFWKRATGNETGSETFTSLSNNGTLVTGVISQFSGCATSGTPFEGLQSIGISYGTNITLPAITTNGNERLVVNFSQVSDNVTAQDVNGYNAEYQEGTTIGGDARFIIFSQEVATAITTVQSTSSIAGRGSYFSTFGVAFLPIVAGNDLIEGSTNIFFSNSGTIKGKTSLTGNADTSFDVLGKLKGVAKLIGNIAVNLSFSGVFQSLNNLIKGAANIIFSSSAKLKGKTSLAANSLANFVSSAKLKGKALSIGVINIIFSFVGGLVPKSDVFETINANSIITQKLTFDSLIIQQIEKQSKINIEINTNSEIFLLILKNSKITKNLNVNSLI